MMAPLSSSCSLQMALSAAVYFIVVLTTCSTQECAQAEELRNISAFLTKGDIKLIQVKCLGDFCHQSNDISKKINKTHRSSVHQENHPKVQTERCGPVICNQTSKCEEHDHEKICVEDSTGPSTNTFSPAPVTTQDLQVAASTTDASEDLKHSKNVPPALVTTLFSGPQVTPSPETVLKLLSASSDGDLDRVKQILAAGHVDVNSRGQLTQTPVMAAAKRGHGAVVEFLVARGADVSLVNMYGNNALHLACMNIGDLETVKLILATGHVDVNSRGLHNHTPVMLAAWDGHRAVVEFLLDRGADVSLVNMYGNNALHLACMNVGDLETVKLILATRHVDVNSRGQLSQTPVMLAAKRGHSAVVEFLMSRGADVSLVDKDSNNALYLACMSVGDLETVKLILATRHVDVNSRGQLSQTPVMTAAKRGHSAVVEFLMSRGADVSLVDKDGNNALHLACMKVGDLETVKLILSLNVLNVNAKNKVGKRAADLARISGHQRVVDLLVSRDGH